MQAQSTETSDWQPNFERSWRDDACHGNPVSKGFALSMLESVEAPEELDDHAPWPPTQ